MRVGPVPVTEAAGAILAHGIAIEGANLKKGRVLDAGDIAALAEAGITEITVARLDADDVPENEAAARLAAALAGPNIRVAAAFTGRVNLYAERAGLLVVDRARIDAINRIDESLTAATLAPFAPAAPREMLATVKIIPFAAPRAALDRAEALARANGPALRLAPFAPARVGLVSTALPQTKSAILDKNRATLSARLRALGTDIAVEERCAHDAAGVARAIRACREKGCSPILVFGASAIVDRRDVVPAGFAAAGGRIEHFGMPVDPGNLLLMGEIGGTPVVGLPGCARSPKRNGFDFVLERLIAGLPVTKDDLMGMGAGGLLAEIHTRPQPRNAPARAPHEPKAAALVLAAGLSRRMGSNKLLADAGGKPLIRRTVENLLAGPARPVIVVLGNAAEAVRTALEGLPVTFATATDFESGLSASLRAGLATLPDDADAFFVCLGDMPRVTAAHLESLLAAFDPEEGRAICVPEFQGKRGNPILWARAFISDMMKLTGDEGARRLLATHADAIAPVPMKDDAVLADVDTPEALERLNATR